MRPTQLPSKQQGESICLPASPAPRPSLQLHCQRLPLHSRQRSRRCSCHRCGSRCCCSPSSCRWASDTRIFNSSCLSKMGLQRASSSAPCGPWLRNREYQLCWCEYVLARFSATPWFEEVWKPAVGRRAKRGKWPLGWAGLGRAGRPTAHLAAAAAALSLLRTLSLAATARRSSCANSASTTSMRRLISATARGSTASGQQPVGSRQWPAVPRQVRVITLAAGCTSRAAAIIKGAAAGEQSQALLTHAEGGILAKSLQCTGSKVHRLVLHRGWEANFRSLASQLLALTPGT